MIDGGWGLRLLPKLSPSEAATVWCAAVAVVEADGVVHPREQQALDDLSSVLGIGGRNVPEGDHLGSESLLALSPEAKDYLIEIAVLASYADGSQSPEELRCIEEWASTLSISKKSLSTVDRRIRRRILGVDILMRLPGLLADDDHVAEVMSALKLNAEDLADVAMTISESAGEHL
jgi:tellurite resistance protein